MLITGTGGKIQFADPAARHWLRQFFGRPGKMGVLPRKVARWVSKSTAGERRRSLVAQSAKAQLLLRLEQSFTDDNLVLLMELIKGKREERSRRYRELTPREREVLFWIGKGKSNAEIGLILGIAPATVSKHLERIYPKIGVENRTAACSVSLETLSS